MPEITRAGLRLLARKDFDNWSMAELAREAGCSVGTLYDRFPDKHAYLHWVISTQFRNLTDTAKAATAKAALSYRRSAAETGRSLVDHIVSELTAPTAAGAIRATIKLATVRPKAIEEFERYRKAVADHAVALLRDRLPKGVSPDTVRIGVQIVLATVTDAVLQSNPGPMSAGSQRMKSALTNIFLGYLGLTQKKQWAGTEAEDDEGEIDNEIFGEPPKDGEFHYDPKEQGFRRAKTPKGAESKKPQSAAKIQRPPQKPTRAVVKIVPVDKPASKPRRRRI